MNGELLAVLDHIEREKGISKEVLIQTVESALVSAARKIVGNKTGEVTVKLNKETGGIKIFSDRKEITSADFGRIAAQTAKQVIIQKIREAERDVIFSDFQSRVGDITTATVHHIGKQGIVVDLGRTEGLLPYKEQVPKENYRQGERIRAYVLDVKKTTRGPQIILSRAHPGLVKRLFELEVPEIYEGIVEIKSVSREPGDRSKIAVWSKDEKIDSVGACVGMRGGRVKNIVRELNGEKIDIVRWNEDIKEYITNALSPAQVISLKVNKEEQKVEVLVEDDQLSLAIGKHGQNVRLAAKLTGWGIDIKNRSQAQEEKTCLPAGEPAGRAGREKAEEEKKAPKKEVEVIKEKESAFSAAKVPGVGPKIQKLLNESGFDTLEKLAAASLEDLTQIKGIGVKTAVKILKAAQKLVKEK